MRLAVRTNRTCDYSLHVAATETDTACRYSNRCWWCCRCYVMFMISLGVIDDCATITYHSSWAGVSLRLLGARHSTGILPPAMVTMCGYSAKVPVVPGAA